MRVKIDIGHAEGNITAPASKSAAHRLLLASAMAEGVSVIDNVSACADIAATTDCLEALGIRIEKQGNKYTVYGKDFKTCKPMGELCCRESGSTLRMLLPSAALSGNTVTFRAKEALMRRPMSVYEELYAERGLEFSKQESSITVKGALKAGEYTVRGDVSSQFISGLIFALCASGGASKIHITPPIESRSYILLTLDSIKKFGINARFSDPHTIVIYAGQKFKSAKLSVEGDYSGAAFIEALNLFGGKVRVDGLDPDSVQGDKIYREYFKALDEGSPTLSIEDCPDLGPILFAAAAAKNGATFVGTARLKIKESDRASAMAQELKKLGAVVTVEDNRVTVQKCKLHAPKIPISGHNDHRIVMSMAILLTLVGGEIEGAEVIDKSYPDFFRDLRSLNIGVKEYE